MELGEGEAVVRTLVENHRQFLAFLERRVGSRAEAEERCSLKQGRSRGLRRRAPPLPRRWRSRGRSAHPVWTGPGCCAGRSPWKCWRA